MSKYLIFALALLSQVAIGQRTAVYTDKDAGYTSGRAYYDSKVYAASMRSFEEFNESILPAYQSHEDMLSKYADFAVAQAAIRLDRPEAEMLVLDFIEEHEPDPIASAASLEIAEYYFADREYDKAIEYYNRTDPADLSADDRDRVLFNMGYAYFVKKEYELSARALGHVSKQIGSDYFYPANYYLGMCSFINGDYESAVKNFKLVGESDEYRNYVPYYTSLLYFALHDFENVIGHGEPYLESADLYNESEIRHLVGQAYFELEKYDQALPYLVEYETNTDRMRPGEFYQLAYTHYQTGNCEAASTAFKEIALLENSMGQRANFYIADCNLKNGDHREARNAFRSVSKMDYDEDLQEEALFNYAKLSAELNYDKEAIQTLDAIPMSSRFYPEAQTILDDVFTYTQDYASALETLESIETLSPKLKLAYQRLSLLRAQQLMNDGDLKAADKAFEQVMTYPVNGTFSAQATYWRAEIAHLESRFKDSRDLFNKYFTLAKSAEDLPFVCSTPVASYSQGYNHLKDNEYGMALEFFNRALKGLQEYHNTHEIAMSLIPDAHIRAGDCYFKLNKYEDAMAQYDAAIGSGNESGIYAQYQKAIILGLLGQPLDKVVLLEEIAQTNKDSRYADDALFELATTYQEMQSTDKAFPALKELVTYHPTSELKNLALLRMGLISYNNGDLNSAIEYYKSVFDNNPTSGEAQDALTALEEIYVQDLSSPDEYFAFAGSVPGYEVSAYRRDSISYRAAEIQYEYAEYSKAIAAFTKYLEDFPNGVNRLAALYHRAESNVILEQFDRALDDYDAVVRKGNSRFYLKSLAKAASVSYHHSSSFFAAYDYYAKLVDASTDPAVKYDAHLGMLRSAYRSERWEQARSAGLAVLNHADATTAEQAEAHFCLGKASLASNNLDDALTHFNSVVKNSNNVMTAEARYQICKIYYDREQYDLAEQMCFNANRDNTNYPIWIGKGLILLSDIYVAKEDFFNAKAPLEAIIENFQGEQDIVDEARSKLAEIQALELQNSRLKADTENVTIDEIDNNEK